MEEITVVMRDYIRNIFSVEETGREVRTTELAKRLNVKPASVTEMFGKLASMGLLIHQPYHGVVLTEVGRKVVREIIRRHRLLERLLVDIVGLETSTACDEASKLELLLSDKTVDTICGVLSHPSECPCGKPIYRSDECCGKGAP